jgi:hypothetical protein
VDSVIVPRLVKTGPGVSQLVEQSLRGFLEARTLGGGAVAFKIGGGRDAGDEGGDGRNKEGAHTGKHCHLLF